MSSPYLRAARHFSALPLGYGVAPGDVNPSEQERLNNLVPQWGLSFRPSDLQSKTLHTQSFRHFTDLVHLFPPKCSISV